MRTFVSAGRFFAPRGDFRWRERIMQPHEGTSGLPGMTPHSATPHHHGVRPIDSSYRLVVRTVLWVIAGLVLLGLVIWWALT
jgi:hypothetical protein